MKMKLFNGKASKIFLAVFCLIVAILLWYFVKYNLIDRLSAISSNLS